MCHRRLQINRTSELVLSLLNTRSSCNATLGLLFQLSRALKVRTNVSTHRWEDYSAAGGTEVTQPSARHQALAQPTAWLLC